MGRLQLTHELRDMRNQTMLFVFGLYRAPPTAQPYRLDNQASK